MKTIELSIKGMTCGHCSASVKKALESVGGVTEASVNLEKAVAEVKASSDINEDVLVKAVENAGYTVQI